MKDTRSNFVDIVCDIRDVCGMHGNLCCRQVRRETVECVHCVGVMVMEIHTLHQGTRCPSNQ